MNFYKHHLGDYDGATAHLSWTEDIAYTRLLRSYYRREKGFSDTAEACRLIRANSKNERDATKAVLAEFFHEETDGWHNKRADQEIAAYQAQASTNKRIARERYQHESCTNRERIVNEPTTLTVEKRAPNQNQNQEPSKPKSKAFAPQAALLDVDPQIVSDWLKVRKEKKAAPTETGIKAMRMEAAKAGLSMQEVLTLCCKNGWAGFKASWDWKDAAPIKLTSSEFGA